MTGLSNLTNARLARQLDKAALDCTIQSNRIFELADRPDEGFADIIRRLGENHTKVMAYRRASDAMLAIEIECCLRLGDQPLYAQKIFLEQSPRYVRNRTKA